MTLDLSGGYPMRFTRPASLIALALLCLIFSGCGAKTPAETLSDADKAFTSDSDYPKAIELYKKVLMQSKMQHLRLQHRSRLVLTLKTTGQVSYKHS